MRKETSMNKQVWERLYKLFNPQSQGTVFSRRASEYSDPSLWGEIEGGYWLDNAPKLVSCVVSI